MCQSYTTFCYLAQIEWTASSGRGNNAGSICVNTLLRTHSHSVTRNWSLPQWGSIDHRLLPGRNACCVGREEGQNDRQDGLSGSIKLLLCRSPSVNSVSAQGASEGLSENRAGIKGVTPIRLSHLLQCGRNGKKASDENIGFVRKQSGDRNLPQNTTQPPGYTICC